MASAPGFCSCHVSATATAAGSAPSNARDNVDVGLQRTEGASYASQNDPADDTCAQLHLDEDSDDLMNTRMSLCFKMLLLRKDDRKMRRQETGAERLSKQCGNTRMSLCFKMLLRKIDRKMRLPGNWRWKTIKTAWLQWFDSLPGPVYCSRIFRSPLRSSNILKHGFMRVFTESSESSSRRSWAPVSSVRSV